MSNQEILTNAGHIGCEPRPDNRLYRNANYSQSTAEVVDTFYDDIALSGQQNLTRTVYRGIVANHVVAGIINNPETKPYLETVLPLSELSPGDHLIYLASNQLTRGQVADDSYSMNIAERPLSTPADIISRGEAQNLLLQTSTDTVDLQQLADLWTPGFGWSQAQIDAFDKSIRHNQQQSPQDRQLWFAATTIGERLVSACMAEPITLTAAGGQPLTFVESTEWITAPDPNLRRRGAMTLALVGLHAQVLDSYHRQGITPVIYAETNISSQACFAGHAAGLQTPSRQLAPQVLERHVQVDDSLRDFHLMHMDTSRQADYTQAAISQTLTNLQGANL